MTVARIETEAQLEEMLSRPTEDTVRAMREMTGDLLILGVGGKMGPSLARLARRTWDEAGLSARRVIGVSRFSSAGSRNALERDRIETIACDLLDPAARKSLPDVPNVLFMLGYKFGAQQAPWMAWAMNTYLPGALAEQYRNSRLVVFSTGNVYPFTSESEPAPTEDTPPAPVGEYATTALGRERLLQFASERYRTLVCLLRLNYAVDLRYGVPIDLAQQLLAGQPIDLRVPRVNMVWQGYANRVALQSFAWTKSPAEILNVTGAEVHRVRDLAMGLGARLGIEATFTEQEGSLSLLNNACRCHTRFGLPEHDGEALLDLVAHWLQSGGRTLDKPTKFQVSDGGF